MSLDFYFHVFTQWMSFICKFANYRKISRNDFFLQFTFLSFKYHIFFASKKKKYISFDCKVSSCSSCCFSYSNSVFFSLSFYKNDKMTWLMFQAMTISPALMIMTTCSSYAIMHQFYVLIDLKPFYLLKFHRYLTIMTIKISR